jgi:hypothetical protein
MAGSKWHESIVPPSRRGEWEAMQVVDFSSPNLSVWQGPLFDRVKVDSGSYVIRLLPLSITASQSPHIVPQTVHREVNKAFLRYFLDNVSTSDEVWALFRRDELQKMATADADAGHPDVHAVVAMGIVAASLVWKFGLDVAPVVMRHEDLQTS